MTHLTTSHRPLMIVGEAWGEEEERAGQAFVGSAGRFLHSCLRQAGIPASDCYFTNVFNRRPTGNNIRAFCGPKTTALPGYRALAKSDFVRAEFAPELSRLFEEIDRVRPNLILALGNTALWALTKKTGIKKYRGATLLDFRGQSKVLPSWHPAGVLRQYELRPILIADLMKARNEMTSPDLVRPSQLIYYEPTLDDLWSFEAEFLRGQPFLSTDIETRDLTITEIGFATADGSRALVVPFYSRQAKDGSYWPSAMAEAEAWRFVRHVCTSYAHVGQNFQYDMAYLWRTVGIPCPYFLGDTMLLHHSLQPEMEKGLGFLATIYTNNPSWKFMRTEHGTLKKGDE